MLGQIISIILFVKLFSSLVDISLCQGVGITLPQPPKNQASALNRDLNTQLKDMPLNEGEKMISSSRQSSNVYQQSISHFHVAKDSMSSISQDRANIYDDHIDRNQPPPPLHVGELVLKEDGRLFQRIDQGVFKHLTSDWSGQIVIQHSVEYYVNTVYENRGWIHDDSSKLSYEMLMPVAERLGVKREYGKPIQSHVPQHFTYISSLYTHHNFHDFDVHGIPIHSMGDICEFYRRPDNETRKYCRQVQLSIKRKHVGFIHVKDHAISYQVMNFQVTYEDKSFEILQNYHANKLLHNHVQTVQTWIDNYDRHVASPVVKSMVDIRFCHDAESIRDDIVSIQEGAEVPHEKIPCPSFFCFQNIWRDKKGEIYFTIF